MHENFENMVAIITGAASGLGLAVAKKLSQFKVRLVKIGGVDRHDRGWGKTSDHAPVWIELKNK